MTAGGIAASDNTDHEGMEAFLAYIRNPRNGFTAAAIFTGGERGKTHKGVTTTGDGLLSYNLTTNVDPIACALTAGMGN